jgi:succinate dehydrogenase / fumarate reductase iron-sulfur subunit
MTEESQATRTVYVYRGDQEGGKEVGYEVPLQPGMVVLDAIHHIQETQAPDLAVRWNCKAAHCGSCSAEVNGKPGLLCKTRMDQFEGDEIHVAPMKTFPLIKDLVTDVSWNYERLEQVTPRLRSRQEIPFTLQQWEVDRAQEFRQCIECFLCQDICHVLREHQGFDRYWGPRLMVKMAELEMHPTDQADRLALLHGEAGVEYCNITHCCSDICPEGIEITHNAIIPLKERVADRYYDPIRGWLERRRQQRQTGPAGTVNAAGQ